MTPSLLLLKNLGLDPDELEVAMRNVVARSEEAVQRIRNAPFLHAGTYVGHSGGKDSVLVHRLVTVALGDVPVIHTPKPKGIRNEVHPLTREFLYSRPFPILYLPDGLIQTEEYAKFSTQVDGTRRAEASRRDGRDVGLVIAGAERSREECPLYLPKGLFGKQYIYPIYDWSDAEVWAAIFELDIPFSMEYYA